MQNLSINQFKRFHLLLKNKKRFYLTFLTYNFNDLILCIRTRSSGRCYDLKDILPGLNLEDFKQFNYIIKVHQSNVSTYHLIQDDSDLHVC